MTLVMSSFQKVVNSASNTSGTGGTKLKNNLHTVSSGIPSLDHVIGGGLPSGAVFAVEEDVLGNYGRVLTKYFLAEGVVCNHHLMIASADEDPHEIVKELPQPCTPSDETSSASEGLDKMKIAWRYEGLGQVESSFGSTTTFGHHFDLSKYIPEDTIKDCKITYCRPDCEESCVKGFKNPMYHKLITNISAAVTKEEYQCNNSSKNKNILRISIQSLGSPAWMSRDCEDDTLSDYGQDLMKFVYCLRVLLRDTTAVAFVTLPSHLFDDENLMKRVLYTVDNAVRIESFAGSSRETNPVYKDYHGLFHVTKLSAINSLVPYVPPSLDLAFKLKRKKFLIEKLHLPPELEESSEREQDDITATAPMCGGFKKKDIDF